MYNLFNSELELFQLGIAARQTTKPPTFPQFYFAEVVLLPFTESNFQHL